MNMDCRGILDFFRKEPIIVHIARQHPDDSEDIGITHTPSMPVAKISARVLAVLVVGRDVYITPRTPGRAMAMRDLGQDHSHTWDERKPFHDNIPQQWVVF